METIIYIAVSVIFGLFAVFSVVRNNGEGIDGVRDDIKSARDDNQQARDTAEGIGQSIDDLNGTKEQLDGTIGKSRDNISAAKQIIEIVRNRKK